MEGRAEDLSAAVARLEASPGSLEMNPFTLAFKSAALEGEYLGEVAKRRWPVLIFIFCFDVACFLFRFAMKLHASTAIKGSSALDIVFEMGHQLANMAMLHVLIGLLNKRSRKTGDNAARQEEVLLSACMALAICNLLASLRADNGQDYVYMSYFLICTSSFLKIRWWVGTGVLASPTVAVHVWYGRGSSILPPDAVVHIVVAWAVGGLMAYLADWYRRQTFANQMLALSAHEKELLEARARMQAQRELAAAQAQAAQRALSVAREKAAHEAKNEFMSLMCHEVRTPLNGCLASAEMLLETPLQEEQRELAKTIRVSGSILLSTVSNFLDFFKLEAGKKLDIVRTLVSLPELVSDVHCIIEAMVGRGGSVALRPPSLCGDLRMVYCDPDRLRGILLNLYTNAAKFTKSGNISLRVRVVEPEYEPEPPHGWAGITITPSYYFRPSTDSNAPRGSWSRDSVDQGLRKLFGSSTNLLLPSGSSGNLLADAAAAGAGSSSGGGAAEGQQPAAEAEDGSATAAAGGGKGGKQGSGQVVHLLAEPSMPPSGARRSMSSPSLTTVGAAAAAAAAAEPHTPSRLGLTHTSAAAAAAAAAEGGGDTPDGTPTAAAAAAAARGSSWDWQSNMFAKGLRHRLAAATAAKNRWLASSGRSSFSWATGPRDSISGALASTAAATASSSGKVQLSSVAELAVAARVPLESGGGNSALPPLPPHASSSAAAAAAAADGGSGGRGDPGSTPSTSGRPPLGGVCSSALPGGAVAAGRVRWLLFEVMDSGVGITEDALQTLFREYVQGTDAEMSKPRTTGGTGLGLSICSKQVGVLGGCIGAHSAKGSGSTFWFKIPVIAAGSEAAGSYSEGAGGNLGVAAAAASECSREGGASSNQQQQPAGQWHAGPSSSSSSSSSRAARSWQWQQQPDPGDTHPTTEQQQQQGQEQLQQQQGQHSSPPGVGGAGSSPSTQEQQQQQAGTPTAAQQAAAAAGGASVAVSIASMANGASRSSDSSSSSCDSDELSREAAANAGSSSNSNSSEACAAPAVLTTLGYRPAPPSVCDPATSSLYALSPEPTAVGRQQQLQLNGSGPQQQEQQRQLNGAGPQEQPPATSSTLGAAAALIPPTAAAAAAAAGAAVLPPRAAATGSSSVPAVLPVVGRASVDVSGLSAAAAGGGGGAAGAAPVPLRPTGVSLDGRRSQLDTSCLAGKRVLLAEDNLINQTVARKMLSSLGMSVEVAANGLEALTAVQRVGERSPLQLLPGATTSTSSSSSSVDKPVAPAGAEEGSGSAQVQHSPQGFDIVLMDMAMPVMGGVEATRSIRAAGYTLPIVAMTANASDRDRDECADSGMNGFLSKPVLREQLARALLAVLGPGAAANAAGADAAVSP